MKKSFSAKSILKVLSFFILFSVIFNISGCKSVKGTRIYPQGEWLYSTVQDESELENAQFLPLIKVAALNELVDNKPSYVWLKFTFTIPQELQEKDLALYAGRINMSDETYVNGYEIGHAGIAPPNEEFSAWNEARWYPIQKPVLNYDGENVLLIKIWTHGEGSVPATLFIGEYADAKNFCNIEKFWNSTLNLMCAFCMIVIGLYQLITFICRPKDKENLFFAILNIVASIYLSVWYIQDVFTLETLTISFLWFQKFMSDIMLFVLLSLLVEFMNAYVRRRERWYVKVIRYIYTLIPIIIVLVQKNYSSLKDVRNLVHIFAVPIILYIVYIIIKSIIVKREGAVSMMIGFIPFVVCVAFDFIPHSVFGLENMPFLSTYSWMIVLMSFMFILAQRFARARNESEYLNKNLEKEVADRTAELSESNKNLENANGILADINKRSERDMALAVNVQRNFYPRTAPKVEGWDIAYIFQPMAGVSGDLYDFFYKGNQLEGCCLFDVSGHGIGSGLVTMLAKTVIAREFEKGKNEKIAKIMANISEEIGQDKGDIENYLTGILLRIKDNYVEYVNGAHPAMLCRSGSSGKVMPALIKGDSSGGSVVGIKDLPADFTGINFTVKKGDSLMLYTDCLYESRNKAGEEMGADNVAKIFANVGNGTAQEQLDNLLSQFYEYTKDVPLNDDLTVLILKKL